jgi:hypothetical protein
MNKNDIDLLAKAAESIGLKFEFRENDGPGIYEGGEWYEWNPLELTSCATDICDALGIKYEACGYGCCGYFYPHISTDGVPEVECGDEYAQERRAVVMFAASKAPT